MVSVAATVPAPETYPVNTLPITAEFVTVAAFPTEVTSPVKLAFVVTFPAVNPAAVPVMFVPTSADGVPSAGVTNVGLVANTAAPVPVSSVNAASSWADVNEPSEVAFPTDVTAPVKFALVVTVVTQELTLVPSQNKYAVLPTATAMPVPAEVFSVTAKDVLFCNT